MKLKELSSSTSWSIAFTETMVVILVGGGFSGAGIRWHSPILILMSIVSSWILIQFFLKLRHSNWQEFGFQRPKSWPQTLGWAIIWTIVLHALIHFILKPLISQWLGAEPDISQFDSVRGNLLALLFILGIVWTTADFGEEMIFRGFFLNRLAALGHNRAVAWVLAILFSSIFFGFGHSYQGEAGIILTAIVGFFFCIFYLLSGKNLWITILIHGLYDTSSFIILFLNLDR